MRAFVIGDVHGRFDNLFALLEKAGLLKDGKLTGDTRVIQLGDLGDFRLGTVERDIACYHTALTLGIEVLWGNHDYATQDPERHAFKGYAPPTLLLRGLVEKVAPSFATASHGYLLTHAGQHPAYNQLGIQDADLMARAINAVGETALMHRSPVINDIGPWRGGLNRSGGILWRDDREDLYNIPQVFGHTRGYVRSFGNRRFCIDVGSGRTNNLAGLWLPDLTVVAVGEDADINEMALNGGTDE